MQMLYTSFVRLNTQDKKQWGHRSNERNTSDSSCNNSVDTSIWQDSSIKLYHDTSTGIVFSSPGYYMNVYNNNMKINMTELKDM